MVSPGPDAICLVVYGFVQFWSGLCLDSAGLGWSLVFCAACVLGLICVILSMLSLFFNWSQLVSAGLRILNMCQPDSCLNNIEGLPLVKESISPDKNLSTPALAY